MRRRSNLLNLLFSFEMMFTLFLFAGRFKADPRFSWFPIDLTLFFFLISLVIGIKILKTEKFRIKKKALSLIYVYLLFVTWLLISLYWTPSSVYAIEKSLNFVILGTWIVFGSLIISQNPERIKRFFFSIFSLSLWMAVEAYMQLSVNQGNFVEVLGGNYIGLGRVIGFATLLIFCYLLFYAKNKLQVLLLFILLCSYLYLLLNVGSRGPFIACSIGMLVPLLFSIRINKGSLTLAKYTVFIFIIVLFLGTYIFFVIQNGKMLGTISRLMTLFVEDNHGSSAATRLEHYNHAIRLWSEKFLTGHGIGAWPLINGFSDVRSYPHNIILEIMVEMGIIGLFLFCLFLYFGIFYVKRNINSSKIYLTFLMLFIFTFFNSLISGDLNDNRLLLCIIFIFTGDNLNEEQYS